MLAVAPNVIVEVESLKDYKDVKIDITKPIEFIDDMIEVFSTKLVTTEEDIVTLDIDREDVEFIISSLEYYKNNFIDPKKHSLTLSGTKYLLKRNGETIQTFTELEEFEKYADEADILDKVENYP